MSDHKILNICLNFFEYLQTEKIRYCHWKSNSHLDKALEGKTDLDILIHEDDKPKFTLALTKFDFKQIFSPPEKQFPGLFDYLGFDKETGCFIHLHVHYKLILGQKYVKNHHLPLEILFFDNLQLSDYKIYIPKPELELFILIIRYCMKFDIVSILKYFKRKELFSKSIKNEFNLLINISNNSKLLDILKESNLIISEKKVITFINNIQNNKLTLGKILKLRRYLLVKLKRFQRNSGLKYNLYFLKINFQKFPYLNKLFQQKKKTIDRTGKFIALVGADGSGKSTLVKDIRKWLAWKIEVKIIYMGIPKQKKLKYLSKLIRAISLLEKVVKVDLTVKFISKLKSNLDGYRWLYVARKRSEILLNAEKYSKTGGLIISDRFPVSNFNSMDRPMDGPRIRKETTPVLIKKAIKEEEYYINIKQPDKIFILNTDIKELRKRKSDLEISEHIKKANAVNQMQESDNIRIINGNSSYDKVLLDIKTKIWESI